MQLVSEKRWISYGTLQKSGANHAIRLVLQASSVNNYACKPMKPNPRGLGNHLREYPLLRGITYMATSPVAEGIGFGERGG